MQEAFIQTVIRWRGQEIWHDGGYTEERNVSKPTNSIKDRSKAVTYNIEGKKSVKMEWNLDDTSNNNWMKVTEVIDNGDWCSENARFEEADCHRPRNYLVINSGSKLHSGQIVSDGISNESSEKSKRK